MQAIVFIAPENSGEVLAYWRGPASPSALDAEMGSTGWDTMLWTEWRHKATRWSVEDAVAACLAQHSLAASLAQHSRNGGWSVRMIVVE